MPREKINDETTTGFYTEVSWRRKPCAHEPSDQGPVCDDVSERGSAPGHVQIASVNDLSPFHFPDIDTGDHFEAGEKFDGWRVTLDEAGIDRLIRTLHKAKRQAFGAEAVISSGMPGECSSPAERVDEAVKAYETAIKEGVNPHKARRDAWASAGYSEDEVAKFEQALADGEVTEVA